jgi:hypothetical protein
VVASIVKTNNVIIMQRIVVTIAALLLTIITAHGQQAAGFFEKGYVHLKNGAVLKGRYIYSSDLQKIRVVTGKNTWVFDVSEVELVSRNRPARQFADDTDFQLNTIEPPKLFSLTEIGVLAGNPDNSQGAPLVLGSSLNYTFRPSLSVGAGVGIEFLKETYLPTTVNMMYKLRDTRFTPYAILQAGYQVPLEGSRTVYYNVVPDHVSSRLIWPGPWPISQAPLTAKGGLLMNPAIGFISHSRTGYGFSMSVGYRFHRLRYSGENDYNLDIDFNRLSVKLGLIIN